MYKKPKVSLFIALMAVFSLLVSCGSPPGAIRVGMETEVNGAAAKAILFADSLEFSKYLKSGAAPHFPGKVILLFDTIYTSTLGKYPVESRAVYLPEDARAIDKEVNGEGEESILYKVKNRFVYRMVVPEKSFGQAILLDVMDTDSIKIAGYFMDKKLNSILLP